MRYVPRRFVSTTRSKSSIGCSSVGPGRFSPAAVTQIERPSSAAAVSTSRSTSAADRTSPTHVSARPPRSRYLVGDRGQLVLRAGEERDARSRLREGERRRAADPAPCPGHDRVPAVEPLGREHRGGAAVMPRAPAGAARARRRRGPSASTSPSASACDSSRKPRPALDAELPAPTCSRRTRGAAKSSPRPRSSVSKMSAYTSSPAMSAIVNGPKNGQPEAERRAHDLVHLLGRGEPRPRRSASPP